MAKGKKEDNGERVMEKKRLKGVTFLAWYSFINGLTGIKDLYMLFGFLFRHDLRAAYSLTQQIMFIIGLLKSICYIAAGLWLINLKEEGRKLLIYVSIATVFIYFINGKLFEYTPPRETADTIVFAVISLIIIWYLTRPKVKEQFK